MTEYWKSQGRKFCDFCKCWIADNRPSIEFHERGKKHQENVNKRLKEIHKNTSKQMKDQKKFENDFKKMEKAAMAAYLKDVENDMVDMTAERLIQEKVDLKAQLTPDVDPCDPVAHRSNYAQNRRPPAAKNATAKSGPGKGTPGKSNQGKGKGKSRKNNAKGTDDSKQLGIKKLWYEARTNEGYTYYWHIETNESVWEAPEEGFMSIEEQEKEAQEQAIQEQFLEQIKKEDDEKNAELLEEQRANAEREKLKRIREKIKEEKKDEEEEINYRRDFSVPEKPQPYGAWKPVVQVKHETVDLQLPEKKPIAYVPVISHEPLIKNFKEKQVSQISTGDSDDEIMPSTFKKRKFGNKNVRRKTSDD